MITSTNYDLLIIRQGAEFVPAAHLTPEQAQQAQQDWFNFNTLEISEAGSWTIAFANRHGQFIEITNTRVIPRSATTSHPGPATLRVIDGGKGNTIKVAVEVSITAPTAELRAA